MPKITYRVQPGIELTEVIDICPFLTEDTMCSVNDKTCCREDLQSAHENCPLDYSPVTVEDE